MRTKKTWIHLMITAGACDPSKEDRRVTQAYSAEYIDKYEVIDIAWAINPGLLDADQEKQYAEYKKARNMFAREMRKDGWEIECSSYVNIWDQQIFKLEGKRPMHTTPISPAQEALSI